MKITAATLLAFSASLAAAIPRSSDLQTSALESRQTCENSPTSRKCWGNYSIDTDWYTTWPNTGVTREYWLSVQNSTMSLDGYKREQVLSFNGTVPGPLIWADWGDNLIIHVTNNLEHNGTAIHWHGLRQLGTPEFDGVPGVSQCPIAPGKTYTYKFQATQYGSTWYHSHAITQYADGLQGPMIINGPATADYDEDLGMLHLSDWSHTPASALWDTAKKGGPPTMEGGLINGTNTFNCTGTTDTKCVGNGKKFETVFEAGKKYRLRLINGATDGHFQFSIDGHSLTVIGNDLVPLVPYTTDSVVVSMGQRYDVIVEANAKSGDFWLRGGWITACSTNLNAGDMTGIVRYNRDSTANPTTISTVNATNNCGDEPPEKLVPHLALNVGNFSSSAVTKEDVNFAFASHFTWTINSTSLLLDWKDPTLLKLVKGNAVFPTEYNVEPIESTKQNPTWAVYVIQDLSGFGITHPIHLHGHDFWVIAQGTGVFDNTTSINLVNPPRRDVASLPGNGYLAMAFKIDNPGSWLMHCHIAWHASEGLAMQFVESESKIVSSIADTSIVTDTCSAWNSYTGTELFAQDDSGV